MKYLSRKHEKLVESLRKLPGIGRKTALRLAFYLLKESKDEVFELAQAIREAKEGVKFCSICGNITEEDICEVCNDSSRDRTTLCVVEEPMDLYSLEKADFYKGVYHVLGGALSPLDGIGPEHLRIDKLIERVKKGEIQEVIVATNPDTEGEATALYISKILKPCNVRITRIATGIPMGSNIDYADGITLSKSFKSRGEM
ncbi:recombination protein RecR [candidate division WOR-3 bacterium]|nr:recombination protein RecR [candidate division WOR-3 bacterium]TET79382.1 MAG: recombination protein RecR [Candidatus Cloacimonadota bacterium]